MPLILSVDDYEDDRLLSRIVIEGLGYRYIDASNGQTALELAQRYQPALILLDICLPDLNGLAVAHQLKQNPQTATIPIIIVTAGVTEETRRQILAFCNEYILKPYGIEKLEAVIQRHCRQLGSMKVRE